MRLWIILCLLPLVCPLVGHADSEAEFIEKLPTGCINWTKSIVTAKGDFAPEAVSKQDPQNQALYVQQAHRNAVHNALETLKNLRMDANRRVANVMTANERVGARVIQMSDDAKIVREQQLPDGAVEVAVRIDLLGGLMQLLLPEDIKQVEPIKAVSETAGGEPVDIRSQPQPTAANSEGVYTGFVVDARGIGAKPAMVPLIVDESGKEVYGSAFVSREYAVQYGVCRYVRSHEDALRENRIAPKPLAVKGLRTLHERCCDIVISNADAAKLRDASANLSFLKQCRVIIVLD